MALPGQCDDCFDPKGWCSKGDKQNDFFSVTLQHGFETCTFIPCYMRAHFLCKYGVPVSEEVTFMVDIYTKEGFQFSVSVTNKPTCTFITGSLWREFGRTYQLEVSQRVYFVVNTPDERTRVVPGTEPINHPTYYHLTPDKRDILDSLTVTDGTIINWRMMETVNQHVDNLDHLVDYHQAGEYYEGTATAVVHALNWTNCVEKNLNIPARALAQVMDKYGVLTIICHPHTAVNTSYTISKLDGRVAVNGWAEFMEKEDKFQIGHNLLFQLYLGIAGAYLFVSHIPYVALEAEN